MLNETIGVVGYTNAPDEAQACQASIIDFRLVRPCYVRPIIGPTDACHRIVMLRSAST